MAHSSHAGRKRKVRPEKPEKPYDEFPLFPHATRRWAKKIRGQFHYFGPWDDPDAALELYLDQKDDLFAGRKPRAKAGDGQVTVEDACNFYLDHIEDRVDSGRLSQHWYQDVHRTCSILCDTVGRHWAIESLGIEDFAALGKRFWQKEVKGKNGKPKMATASPVTAKGHIVRTRGLFNWLMKNGHVQSVPRYGTSFDPPETKEIERHRNAKADKILSRKEIRALLRVTKGTDQARQRMHAAILLAINTGAQNIDVETLKFSDIDWKGRWYNQPRAKSGKRRRAKLWRRTITALNRMIGDRDREPESRVFVSNTGGVWHGRNCLAKEFPTYRDEAGITTERAGFQFLRHSFITEADQLGDRQSVQICCGHASRQITDNYVHRVNDPRLEALARHVERWLTGGDA